MVDIPAAASTAFVKGNAVVDNAAGFITNGSAGGNVDVRYVCMQTITTGATAGELVLCCSTDGVTFEADTDAAWAQTDVGTEADLAAAGTVDPDASTDDVFYIERGVGTAGTDTVVIGHFTRGVPNS